jgi:hypothetical protein
VASAVLNRTHIRAATSPRDQQRIEAIRKQNYAGQPMLNDPAVEYIVYDNDGLITAMYGVKFDKVTRRALIVDMYGTNARDWMKLYRYLLAWADKFGIQISGWVLTTNPHIKTFFRTGGAPHMVLVRREAQI